MGLESGGPSLTKIDACGGDKVSTYSAANGKAPLWLWHHRRRARLDSRRLG